ncbi:MAG: hypothetical protein II453_10865, partial [Alphaproteobacteria bacterium]|nr:hypothetical protein [Alphaproteobacteria bacterium]
MSVIKNLLAVGVSCLVCVNTYASESSSDEEDNKTSEGKFAERQKIMVRLKELTKIDYGIWAYDKISRQKDSHWIKQPELFKSAVTVIGGAISAYLANSDEFELKKEKKLKNLITFAANPTLYNRANWNAFICYNLINDVAKASKGKTETVDVNEIFDDIKRKALKHYENANIEDLASKLDTNISDIKKYNRVLDLSAFLELFSELKSKIKNGKDYTSCIVNPRGRKLNDIQLKDVKNGTIKIRGSGEFIKLQYNGYTRDWRIRRAYGLNYPMTGKFFNTHNKFCLDLEFDETKNVWRTSAIKSFKKIKYIQPNEQKEVTNVLYDDDHLKRSMQAIETISKYMDSYKCENASDAANAAVEKIINDN